MTSVYERSRLAYFTPSPHQWYLCVVLALPPLSMGPKREREIGKEVARKRETLLLRNISLSDIPLWFWCENSNIFPVWFVPFLYVTLSLANSVIKQIKTGTRYRLYNMVFITDQHSVHWPRSTSFFWQREGREVKAVREHHREQI